MGSKIQSFKFVLRATLLVSLSMSGLAGVSSSFAQSLDRLVEIDFEQVPNAKQYEVKVTSLSNSKTPAITYNLKNTSFSQRLSLGTWRIEVRSYDRRGVPGRWTPLGDVNIGFKAPKLTSPAANMVVKTNPDVPVPVKFQWDAFDTNALFKLIIKSSESERVLIEQDVKGGSAELQLKQGSYSWTVKSTPPPGVQLDGQDPSAINFKINAGRLEDPVISKFEKSPPESIEWKLSPHAASYALKLTKIKDNKSQNLNSKVEIFSNSVASPPVRIPGNLDAGIYKFSVIARADGFEDSKERFIQFKVRDQAVLPRDELATSKKEAEANEPQKGEKPSEPNHVPVDFLQGSIGPVFWNYDFISTSGQKFSLVAGTLAAISADVNKWFSKTTTSAWAAEIRGRQTNIYLYDQTENNVAGQSKVTVADRRLALIGRRRKIKDRVGIDAIVGIGSHHFTYLVQNESSSIVTPIEGQLIEIYFGGALDWQMKTGNHAAFDLTFHPVGTAIGVSADQTWQYTATLKYLKEVLQERSYLSIGLENFRSRINTHSDQFEGEAQTISTWYRMSAGLAIKI